MKGIGYFLGATLGAALGLGLEIGIDITIKYWGWFNFFKPSVVPDTIIKRCPTVLVD